MRIFRSLAFCKDYSIVWILFNSIFMVINRRIFGQYMYQLYIRFHFELCSACEKITEIELGPAGLALLNRTSSTTVCWLIG